MNVRCLLGHDFGDVKTDRDRRERGNEVIVTVREYRECARCSETRVVSENKEVTHATSPEPSAPVSTDVEAGSWEPVAGADGDDVEYADEFDDVDAEEDDGVILEDEPEERPLGAWPEAETAAEERGESTEPTPWPEVEGDDEGYAAELNDSSPLEGVQFGSGLTPEAAAVDAGGGTVDDGGDVLEPAGGGNPAGGGDREGFRRASPIPSPTGRMRSVAPETEFFCAECSFTASTEDSSLRPGDICPDCRLGYLTEREC